MKLNSDNDKKWEIISINTLMYYVCGKVIEYEAWAATTGWMNIQFYVVTLFLQHCLADRLVISTSW